jgi:hypothetical protein
MAWGDDVTTIEPDLRSHIDNIAARVTKNTPVRFTSITRRHCASVVFRTSFVHSMPALA